MSLNEKRDELAEKYVDGEHAIYDADDFKAGFDACLKELENAPDISRMEALAKIEKLEAELELTNNSNQAHFNERELLRRQIAKLEAELQSAKDTLDMNKGQIEYHRRTTEKLEAELAEVRAKLLRAQEECGKLADIINPCGQ